MNGQGTLHYRNLTPNHTSWWKTGSSRAVKPWQRCSCSRWILHNKHPVSTYYSLQSGNESVTKSSFVKNFGKRTQSANFHITIHTYIVYWLSTDIQTPKRKHKHTDSINNVGQWWKGSKRSASNHPNRYSTLETSTSQCVSKQLNLARDVKSVSTGRLLQGLTTRLLKK